MANEQYDVSEKFYRLFKEKEKQRQAIREYFLQRVTSPHPGCSLEVDPAVIRYHALVQYRGEFYKPNPKNIASFLCLVVFPIIGLRYWIQHVRTSYDSECRKGQIAYKDRKFKTLF